MSFKDHFSQHAKIYAQARPNYPPILFDWMADGCKYNELAWDAGCGSGQASVALAEKFNQVIASDPSAEQIAHAPAHPRLRYLVESAEDCQLPDQSVDLICVMQAYHWFNHAKFCDQANRVLKPEGVITLCSYGLSRVDPAVDQVFMYLYSHVLGKYWPPERVHIENGYRDLPFPFIEIVTPDIGMSCHWTCDQYLAYLRSWSAAQRYQRETGVDAVAQITDRMRDAWGAMTQREVVWPLTLRAGRKT